MSDKAVSTFFQLLAAQMLPAGSITTLLVKKVTVFPAAVAIPVAVVVTCPLVARLKSKAPSQAQTE